MKKYAAWVWPMADLGGGADGSAMSKLFRGGSLSDTALLARESVQNSDDAAQRFKDEHPEAQFKVRFRFVHLFDEEKAAFVEALDLRGMRDRRQVYADAGKDPLQAGSALDALEDPKLALKLLYVEDYGTHGLFGDPSIFQESHLFMAMYYIGASTKAADAGGSYGFGKSALERASRTHSVIAHTTFERFEDDPVRTRLVGFTWWPNLQVGKTMHNGRASFSDPEAGGQGQPSVAIPFADDDADAVAAGLGFHLRDPADLNELGTSFLIVDPAIEPGELLQELEKWWWPALEEHRLDVEVVLPSGEVKVPKPASNPFVAQFLRAFRIATKLDEPGDANSERMASKTWRNRSGAGGQDLGNLALVVAATPVDEEGEETQGTPLVALMRSPRMVIGYQSYPRRRVPLRGVFVSSDKTNDLLRETEPSSHDRWTEHSAGDLSQQATETARAVMSKIARSVSDMAKDIAPPPPKQKQSLGLFSKLMTGFIGSKRGPVAPPPPGGGERIELLFPDGRPSPEVLNDENVRVKTRFTIRVADGAEKSACEARVSCQMFIHEDENQSQSRWPVTIRPSGKTHGLNREEDGSWVGVINKTNKVTFVAESDPYPNLWTVSMQPAVTRTSEWTDS